MTPKELLIERWTDTRSPEPPLAERGVSRTAPEDRLMMSEGRLSSVRGSELREDKIG